MSENANFITLLVYFSGNLHSSQFKFLREWVVS